MADKPGKASVACPCESRRPFSACCGPFLDGEAIPPSAEALMRSRYTAYVLARESYLRDTWHPSTRPTVLDLVAEPRPKWLGLDVLGHAIQDATHATVEFVARYKLGGRAHRLHEISRFVREGDRWFYVDGDVD